MIKAGKEKKKSLLDITGKISVKASVQVQLKGIKDESPAQEPLLKNGNREKSFLLDGE